MKKLPIIIAFGSDKGGIGKTTAVAAFAHILSETKKILVIDADPSGNLSTIFVPILPEGVELEKVDLARAVRDISFANPPPVSNYIMQTRYENIDVMPSGSELAEIKMELISNLYKKKFVYKKLVDAIAELGNYDYILFDSHPGLEEDMAHILIASKWLIIPITTGAFSIDGLSRMVQFMSYWQEEANPDINIAKMFFNMVETSTNLAKDYLPMAKKSHGKLVSENSIPKDEKMKKAETARVPITEVSKKGRAATAYRAFVKEVQDVVEK